MVRLTEKNIIYLILFYSLTRINTLAVLFLTHRPVACVYASTLSFHTEVVEQIAARSQEPIEADQPRGLVPNGQVFVFLELFLVLEHYR